VEDFGDDIVGRVPGLFLSKKGGTGQPYPTLAGRAGLLIPVNDAAGRIAGFQIRRDDAGPTTVGAMSSRYAWFSSSDRSGGCGSGAPIHVARPVSEGSPGDAAWITEGPLKADIAADRLGRVVLGLPGAHHRDGVQPALRAGGAKRAVIAYDMDRLAKPTVQRAADRLAVELTASGIPVQRASWDPGHKGLDDALVAGLTPTVTPYPIARRPGQLERVPAALVPAAAPWRLRTLEEARAEHEHLFRNLIARHEPGATVVASTTGSGKTAGLARALVGLLNGGTWPSVPTGIGDGTRSLRLLYLAQTKEQVVAFTEMTGGLATVVEGRNPAPEHAWGCHHPVVITLVGERRHKPAVDVCSACKEEHQSVHGRSWRCNYLGMKKATEEARLVAAPFGAFLNGSGDLRRFDVVIGDEAVIPSLTELVAVTLEHTHEWLARMDELNAEQHGPDAAGCGQVSPYGLDNLFRRFVLAWVLVLARATNIGLEWRPALPLLREACPDLDELIVRLLPLEPNDSTERYAFETPRLAGTDSLVPLRLIRELITAVAAELSRPEGADTRLWMSPEGLRLFVVREHLVRLLRDRTLINLDATPDPTLRYLFPGVREVRVDVPTPMRVTQVTDYLATRRELLGSRGPARCQRIAAALEAVTADASCPVVFTFKDLDPSAAAEGAPPLAIGNPSAEYGHFDAETRGLNRFGAADVLAVVGRYSHPINVLRAQVQGLRFAPEPPAINAAQGLALLRYEWRPPDGTSLGRWTRADPDPDVDVQIRWSEASTVLQAVGRGRAALRPADAPLEVYLFTNLPIAGLPIDRIATLAELGVPPPSRRTPRAFLDARDARNAATAAANRELVLTAIASLRAEGAPVTVSAVSARSSVSRVTLTNNATLRHLVAQARADSDLRPAAPPRPATGPVNPSADTTTSSSGQGFTPPVAGSTPAATASGPQPVESADKGPAAEPRPAHLLSAPFATAIGDDGGLPTIDVLSAPTCSAPTYQRMTPERRSTRTSRPHGRWRRAKRVGHHVPSAAVTPRGPLAQRDPRVLGAAQVPWLRIGPSQRLSQQSRRRGRRPVGRWRRVAGDAAGRDRPAHNSRRKQRMSACERSRNEPG